MKAPYSYLLPGEIKPISEPRFRMDLRPDMPNISGSLAKSEIPSSDPVQAEGTDIISG